MAPPRRSWAQAVGPESGHRPPGPRQRHTSDDGEERKRGVQLEVRADVQAHGRRYQGWEATHDTKSAPREAVHQLSGRVPDSRYATASRLRPRSYALLAL